MAETLRVEGLKEFQRALKQMSKEHPKALRRAQNVAADLVVRNALPKVPVRSGAARRSLKAASTQTATRVRGGGARAAYYPWLDFGGRVGRARSVSRPFRKEGRYLYKTYYALRDSGEFQDLLSEELVKVGRAAGLEVE